MIKKTGHLDYYLLGTVACLVLIGITILVSVSTVFSQEKFGTTTYYLFHQLVYGILPGIVLGFIAYKVPLSFIKKNAWLLILLNLILMIVVFIPGLGVVSGGAGRWVNLGGFNFQPSELLKLTFIIYLAVWLSSRIKSKSVLKQKGNWKYTLLPFFVILGFVSLLLYLQSDASTLLLIAVIGCLIYFSSAIPVWHTVVLFTVGLIPLILFLILSESYRIKRIMVFLGIVDDPMVMGYQIKQALITIGSGGLAGLGLGMSRQKFDGLLPETMSDSIFAVYAEEVGFLGAMVLVSLFLFLAWRGFKIAKESNDKFCKFFAVGISSWICIQAFINIGAMVGILPVTGIPLPFIGYGGSHVVAELIGVGILFNISKGKKG